jgi:hypothetical protein
MTRSNMDDFEQQLRRQTPAPPPANWRAEILEAARQSRTGLQPVPERTEKPAHVRAQTAYLAPASNTIGTGGWSSEIQPAFGAPAAPAGDRLQTCPTLLVRLREWLWPHPAAWASLAAVWIVLFSVQRQTETAIQSEMIALRAAPEEVLEAFAQRQMATERLLAGLDFEIPTMDRLKPVRRHPIASPPLMLLAT